MRFLALGPLTIRHGEEEIRLGGPKPAALLAALLMEPRTVIPADRLVTQIWDRPPPSANALVHTYVSSVRRSLAPLSGGRGSLVRTRKPGYQLDIDSTDNDVEAFRSLADEGRVALREQKPEEAAECYQRALSLWRGNPLEGIDAPVARCAVGIEESRIEAELGLAEARLQLAHYNDVIALLTNLTTANPTGEEAQGLLMRALYLGGRQAEALAAYRSCREYLVHELGVEPGEELRQLHTDILQGTLRRPRPEQVTVAEPATPNQLPPDIADFTGRQAALARILELPREYRGTTATPTIVMSGFAGTGKSTLAVHAAHRLRPLYPDGTLFADLHGSGGDAATAGVFARFLRALGVAGTEIPGSTGERAELFRMHTAHRGLLLVLDNARDEESGAGAAAGIFGPWQRLSSSGNFMGSPSVLQFEDGNTAVYASNTNGDILANGTTTPGGGFGKWQPFGNGMASGPEVKMFRDGKMYIYAVHHDGNIYGRSQKTVGGHFGNWQRLSSSAPTRSSISPDGTLPVSTINARA